MFSELVYFLLVFGLAADIFSTNTSSQMKEIEMSKLDRTVTYQERVYAVPGHVLDEIDALLLPYKDDSVAVKKPLPTGKMTGATPKKHGK